MSIYHTRLALLRAQALVLTCTCGRMGTKALDGIVADMPPGSTVADLAALPCGKCGPKGRAAEIRLLGTPAPAPKPEMDF